MDINILAAASLKLSVAIGSAVSVWAVALGDVGMGALGIIVLTATACLNIYSKFRDERRLQMRKDLEAAKATWKGRYDHARDEIDAYKQLVSTLRQEIEILRGRTPRAEEMRNEQPRTDTPR